MAVSKLESLPNELFIEIFEHYLDGIDILVGFHSLNRRFDNIISRCSRFYLDFRRCRKAHFRSCLQSLRNDRIGKVTELILSEQNAPGQMRQFISFFPSLAEFTQLRKLQLDFHVDSVAWAQVLALFRSLSTTPIETISIDLICRDRLSNLANPVNDVYALQTLQRLTCISSQLFNEPVAFSDSISQIEYLKCTDESSELWFSFEIS